MTVGLNAELSFSKSTFSGETTLFRVDVSFTVFSSEFEPISISYLIFSSLQFSEEFKDRTFDSWGRELLLMAVVLTGLADVSAADEAGLRAEAEIATTEVKVFTAAAEVLLTAAAVVMTADAMGLTAEAEVLTAEAELEITETEVRTTDVEVWTAVAEERTADAEVLAAAENMSRIWAEMFLCFDLEAVELLGLTVELLGLTVLFLEKLSLCSEETDPRYLEVDDSSLDIPGFVETENIKMYL